MLFFRGSILKSAERVYVLIKNGTRECNNCYVTITGNLIIVNTLTFKSNTLEKAAFPYKTARSEVSVKTNTVGSINGPITKARVLPVTTSFFQKFCFSLRTL